MTEPANPAPGFHWPGPDDWTPEQIEEFCAIERAQADGRWPALRVPPEIKPRQVIVLRLEWAEDGEPHSETFGPWSAASDDDTAHLVQAHDFLGEWSRLTGLTPDKATVHVVLDPGQWIAEHEQPPANT